MGSGTIAPVKGPPITVSCKCGEVRHVPYGETWTCETCGRRWNTAQIPEAEYWGIMREMRNYRLVVVGIALGLAVVFGALALDCRREPHPALADRARLLVDLVHAVVATKTAATDARAPELAADAGVSLVVKDGPCYRPVVLSATGLSRRQ